MDEPAFSKLVAVEKPEVTLVSPTEPARQAEPARQTKPAKVISSPVNPSTAAGIDQGAASCRAIILEAPSSVSAAGPSCDQCGGTFSCVSEMVRDWELLCREKREFELSKREFKRMKRELQDCRSGVERVKKLEWDLSTSSEETARVRELHQKAAADWKTACEQENAKLAKAVDAGKLATSRFSAFEAENKGLVEKLALRDTEVVSRDDEIARLRAQLKEMSDAKDNESAHRVVLESEVQVLQADKRWLIYECIPHVVDLVKGSPEFQLVYSQLLTANKFLGRQQGFDEDYQFAEEGLPKTSFELHDVNCQEGLDEKIAEFDNLSFGILKNATDCTNHLDLSGLKAILAREDEEAGPSGHEEEAVDYDNSDDEEPVGGAGDGDGDVKA
ncbi:hypothetical protein L1987_02979 [Smallanthus sonchifolius]|uniref:Uncharacterized protein n=1 Tax=Smallanthus sonchifolius TaxID=185202 RepID=A0ACB9K9C4_9ASTR|nr:hypothetical protein L1987_02979 [Smallanthus sonchifolius]